VDDASEDDTPTLGRDNACRVISHPYPHRQRRGGEDGNPERLGEGHCTDGRRRQHRPATSRSCWSRFQSGGFDMVVGARSMDGHASHRRWAANGVFNRLASWMTNQHVVDLTSGFRVARTELLREIRQPAAEQLSLPDDDHDVVLPLGLHRGLRAGGRCKERIGESHNPADPRRRPVPADHLPDRDVVLAAQAVPSGQSRMFGLPLRYTPIPFLPKAASRTMSALLYTTSLLTFLIGLVSEQITNPDVSDEGAVRWRRARPALEWAACDIAAWRPLLRGFCLPSTGRSAFRRDATAVAATTARSRQECRSYFRSALTC